MTKQSISDYFSRKVIRSTGPTWEFTAGSTVSKEQEEPLDACICNVLAKFQSVSRLKFQLKKGQKTVVKSMLIYRDVLAILPTGYGKTFNIPSLRDGKRATE